MSKNEPATIGNATAIIERFGGIRPMASKINVPVTTIQGWKKRDAIPVGRIEHIQQAAQEHNVNIADILDAASIANQNAASPAAPVSAPPRFSNEIRRAERPAPAPEKAGDAMPEVVYEDIVKKISATEKKAVAKSTALNIFFLAIAAGAVAMLLWPQGKTQEENARIAALEEEVTRLTGTLASVRLEQTQLDQMIPDNFTEQLNSLKEQVAEASAAAAGAIGPYTGVLEQRLQQIEESLSAAGSPVLASLIEHFDTLRASVSGEEQITAAWNELAEIAGQSPEAFQAALQSARIQGTMLGQTLTDVPQESLQSGAALFAMVQVREKLSRDNSTTESDLQVLKQVVNDSDIAGAVDQLAPLSSTGAVLTPEGLAREFNDISEEVVKVSLENGNATLADKARARLNNVMQVEKNGALVSGTPVQAAVARTQSLLAEGDIAGAIAEVKSLQGPALNAAEPWLGKANITLAAQQLRHKLVNAINVQAYGRGGVTTADAPLVSDPADLYRPVQ